MENGHPDIEASLSYSDFAIIARNKYVFYAVEELLQKSKIPYGFKKSSTGIESESIAFKIFDLELRLLANSKDLVHAKELDNLKKKCLCEADYSFVHKIVAGTKPDDFNLNTRRNVIVTYNGRPVTLIEASELTGISYYTLIGRRRRGWPEVKLLETPVKGGRRHE